MVETEEMAKEVYLKSGAAHQPSGVEAIPEGWVVYNASGPLALVTNDGQVQLLSDKQWKPIQAKHGGNW